MDAMCDVVDVMDKGNFLLLNLAVRILIGFIPQVSPSKLFSGFQP